MTDIAVILEHGNPLAHRMCVLTATAIGGWFIARDARLWSLPTLDRINILLVVMLGGMIGSILPSLMAGGAVGSMVNELANNKADGLLSVGTVALLGPKTIIGGVLGGFIAICFFKRIAGITYDTSDAFARGASALMAIGRLGCVFQHCCFGCAVDRQSQLAKPPWYSVDQGDGIARYPVQIIELSGEIIICLIIFWLHQRQLLPHRRLFLLFAMYGSLRFVLEFFREPLGANWFGLNIYQLLAIYMAVTGVWMLIKRRNWVQQDVSQQMPA